MRRIVVLGVAALTAIFPAAIAPAQQQPVATIAKPFVPSLADMMLLVQTRHAKLWLAGRAGNWQLANFAIHEMEEGLEDMAKLHPNYKDSPIGPMIESSVKAPIEEIEKAIKSRNRAAFTGAYDRLTAACNTCHRSTNHGFIVIQRPVGSAFPNQSFAPARR